MRTLKNMNPFNSACDPMDNDELLKRAQGGDRHAIDLLFAQSRERLQRMIRCRLDPRLHSRVDDSDIIQEAFLEATRQLTEYFEKPRAPFFLWLRSLVGYKLLELHRHHLGVQARTATREVSINRLSIPGATTTFLADHLLGGISTPSRLASRAEMKKRLEDTLVAMNTLDREVITLRHFEQLTNSETALTLDLSEAAASSRYLRALKRLRHTLKDYVGMFES